jgi:hypothetical protein
MTTETLVKTLEQRSPTWIAERWDSLMGGDYFVTSRPYNGQTLVLCKEQDAQDNSFEMINVGRVVEETVLADGSEFDVATDLFPDDKTRNGTTTGKKMIRVRMADGVIATAAANRR